MKPVATSHGHRFGTFSGVFTPSILTILGVIIFMRANFVVGQAGISGALLILLIAEIISILTTLSLAGISTNTPVKGGGAYYIISRVLGPEFGGSIGLTLFLAQSLSVPFYILGFTESMVKSFPTLQPYFTLVAIATMLVLFIINLVGAGWAIKTQYLVMTLLGLALLSFLGGALLQFHFTDFTANWQPAYTSPKYNFWIVFAIYFPAVTGIMAGVNMSGDLRSPAQSIVNGTFAAVLTGALIYLLQIILCGGMTDRAILISQPYQILIKNALFGSGFLVVGGVFAATLSSALGSFLGAPRIMQALARDHVLPFLSYFSKGSRKNDEPRHALFLTALITLALLLISAADPEMKAFDLVAEVVTMFFLCTYSMINLAAFVESFGSNPSFRPRFRFFHWSIGLLGTIGCTTVMFLVNAGAAFVAVVIIALLYIRIKRQSYTNVYGDARRGFLYSLVAQYLHRLDHQQQHAKNWRPTLLVLSGNPDTRLTLVTYANWLAAKRGIITLAEILQGTIQQLSSIRDTAMTRLQKFVSQNNLNIFTEVIVTEDFDHGLRVLLQAQSIGPLKPNTILLGWPREEIRQAPFAQHLRDIQALRKNCICVLDRGIPREISRRVDIWWRGRSNGGLMLILAYLLTRNMEWRQSKIRILRAVSDEQGRQPAHEALSSLAEKARIEADVSIIVSTDPILEILPRYSENASVVFMGFAPPQSDAERVAFFAFHQQLSDKLPTTILINSNREADLLA